jgi:hypothetical protein
MTTKFLATVRPRIDKNKHPSVPLTTAYAANDLLFDWHRFEIPRGEACINNFNIIMPGINSMTNTSQNKKDFIFYIARSVNGQAPPDIGFINASVSSSAGKIAFAGCRNHIVYSQFIDASALADSTYTSSYYIIRSGDIGSATADVAAKNLLQTGGVNIGNSKYNGNYNDSTSQPGMSSYWIAAVAVEADFDFGTNIKLNQVGDQDAVPKSTTSETTLTVDTGNADDILSVGDELVAADGAKIGKVTEVVSATSIKVDHVEEALENNDEILVANPIIFNFGIEY